MTKQKFLWLVRTHYRALVRQANYCSESYDGEDIVNSFIIYILEHKVHLRINGSNKKLKNWLWICIRNRAYRTFRGQPEITDTRESMELFYTPERMELKTDIERALVLMSAQDRLITTQVLMGNDTYESLAKTLGMCPSEILLRLDEIKDFLFKHLRSYNVGKFKAKNE